VSSNALFFAVTQTFSRLYRRLPIGKFSSVPSRWQHPAAGQEPLGSRSQQRFNVLTPQSLNTANPVTPPFLAAVGLLLVTSCLLRSGELTPSTTGPVARVVSITDREATDAFQPRADVVRRMLNRAMTNLTGKATVAAAWASLVSTQEIVGIKVYSVPGPNSGTRPAVTAAVVEGLLAAGLSPKNIIVWDKQTTDLRLAGYFDLAARYGIRVAGSAQTGYDEKAFYDTALLGNLVWGDLEFGRKGTGVGRKSFVSKLVSQEMTKIINISPLLNHNLAGVSGNLYSLAIGSVDNLTRFESDPNRMATAIPEIYALKELSDKVIVSIVDALICQYEGEERGLLHYSTVLNELRVSRDPVALDVLSLQELQRERQSFTAPSSTTNPELYNNAALLELGISDLKRIQVEKLQ
jgi:hypothetical protein